MRIAQVSTLAAPVSRESAGSVESFVWLLSRGLVQAGHEVTVFACAGSELSAGVELAPTLAGPYGADGSLDDWHLCEWLNLQAAVRQSPRFDLIHSHAYLWGLTLEAFARAPMVHTTHIVPDRDAAQLWRMHPKARVTALSCRQWDQWSGLQPAAIIPHGVDVSQFTFCSAPDDYVCYLGRFVSGKGPLQAVAVARALGLPLRLAGPENAYFREHIKPLVDGKNVEYLGFVKGAQRSALLGHARALIYPIQYPEAFGLVLIEAMLCGTPVAATGLGAVPEIVDDNLSGCLADDPGKLAEAVKRCLNLNRSRIRAVAEERFSAERMTRDYLGFYEHILAHPDERPRSRAPSR